MVVVLLTGPLRVAVQTYSPTCDGVIWVIFNSLNISLPPDAG